MLHAALSQSWCHIEYMYALAHACRIITKLRSHWIHVCLTNGFQLNTYMPHKKLPAKVSGHMHLTSTPHNNQVKQHMHVSYGNVGRIMHACCTQQKAKQMLKMTATQRFITSSWHKKCRLHGLYPIAKALLCDAHKIRLFEPHTKLHPVSGADRSHWLEYWLDYWLE